MISSLLFPREQTGCLQDEGGEGRERAPGRDRRPPCDGTGPTLGALQVFAAASRRSFHGLLGWRECLSFRATSPQLVLLPSPRGSLCLFSSFSLPSPVPPLPRANVWSIANSHPVLGCYRPTVVISQMQKCHLSCLPFPLSPPVIGHSFKAMSKELPIRVSAGASGR